MPYSSLAKKRQMVTPVTCVIGRTCKMRTLGLEVLGYEVGGGGSAFRGRVTITKGLIIDRVPPSVSPSLSPTRQPSHISRSFFSFSYFIDSHTAKIARGPKTFTPIPTLVSGPHVDASGGAQGPEKGFSVQCRRWYVLLQSAAKSGFSRYQVVLALVPFVSRACEALYQGGSENVDYVSKRVPFLVMNLLTQFPRVG